MQTCTVFGCAGVRICVPGSDGGFTSCMPTNPLPESCNGMDDDCNGAVEDVPDRVCGLGPCRRVAQACIDGGVSACLPGNPGTEFCNGIDDDCNGTIDDGVAPLTCGAGACANTVPACMLDGGANMCVPAPPSVEICNNIDDNCNGTRDEKADGGALTQTCYTGPGPTRNIGRCIDGSQSCTTGAWGSCLGEVVPGTESCNTFDDNCNGRIDEQADGGALQQACYTGSGTTRNVGRCRDGAQSCVSGSFGACSGDVLPGTETCNNVDDNCNGATDESLTQACYTGPAPTRLVGRCRDGTQTCAAGSFGACNGQVLPNASEICGNSIDDNCAGGVDEGCSGCNPSGAYTLDAGVINYACCGGSVTLDISQFQISPTSVFPGPTQPGTSLAIVGAGPTCPSGAFTYRVVLGTPSAFTCVETYTLTGNFVGPNTFVGTYTASFAGAACSNSLCLAFGGPACTNQSWNVSAGR